MLRGRIAPVIQDDEISRALVYLAYLLFILLVLFAIAYSNWQIALIGITELMFILMGKAWATQAGVNVQDRRLTKRETAKIGTGVLIALVGFGLADLTVAPLFGLFGSASTFFGGYLTTLPQATVIPIASLVVLLGAIAEEVFFRQAAFNYFASRGGMVTGLVVSAVIFGIAHIPVDGLNLPVLTILTISGGINAFGGVYSGKLSSCILAHLANNAISLGLLSVILVIH
jgi:membrane protease YdiL (CAAX protease family)